MNAIGTLFDNQGGRSENLKAWKFIDLLSDAFPETVSKLKTAQNDEAAGRVLIELLEQAEQSEIGETAHEKEALLEWIEKLLTIQV